MGSSHVVDEILPEIERLILSKFEGWRIWQRGETPEEMKQPVPDEAQVYLKPLSPQPEEPSYNFDHRIYPVEVVVKFDMRGMGLQDDEDDQHAVQIQMHNYLDTLLSLVKAFDYSGKQVYQAAIDEMEIDYTPEEIEDEKPAHQHRLRMIWHFRTVENYPV